MKKIKKYFSIMISIMLLFCTVLGTNYVKAEETNHNFSFNAFTCGLLDENNKCVGYNNDYDIEEFDYSKLEVEPGEVIKLGVHYIPGANTTWDMSVFFNYNKDLVTPIYSNDSLLIEKSNDLNENYVIDYNDVTDLNKIGTIVQDGSTIEENRVNITEEGDLYYVYFKVKDDAPLGSKFKFTYDLDDDKTHLENGENITSDEIEFEVKDRLSSNNYLINLSIDELTINPEFNKKTLEYEIDLIKEVTSINISTNPEDETATVLGNGTLSVNPSQTSYPITVTAENGDVRTYIININWLISNNLNISNINITNGTLSPEFSNDISSYIIKMDESSTNVGIEVTPESSYTTITGNGCFEATDNSNFVVTLTAESGDTRTVKFTSKIIDEKFPIVYQDEEETFDGTNYLDTGIKLYSEENYLKDYEVGFTIDEYNPDEQDDKQATMFNNKYENESLGYPGIVFRKNNTGFQLAENINNTKGQKIMTDYTLPLNVKVIRKDNIVYYTTSSNFDSANAIYSSGSYIEDLSGNNNNGTMNNVAKDMDSGITFNGTDSYVSIGQINLEKFTIDVTAETNSYDNSQYIIGNVESGGFGLYFNTNKEIVGLAYIDGAYRTIKMPNYEINTKYHIVLTYDLNELVMYVNGSKITPVPITTTDKSIKTPNNNTYLTLGANPAGSDGTSEFLNGKIYDAKVYDRVLSEDEILSNKTYSNGLLLYYDLNEKLGVLQDTTGFNQFFEKNAWFGAGEDSSGNPFRYFKGKMSNMYVRLGEIEDTHTVTYPDNSVEKHEHNSIINLGKNTESKVEIGTVTFKYHNGVTEDTTSTVTKTSIPHGFKVNEIPYDDDSSIFIDEDKVITYNFDEDIIEATMPQASKEGYKFLGWFTEETGGEKVEAYKVPEDIILHAQYEEIKEADLIQGSLINQKLNKTITGEFRKSTEEEYNLVKDTLTEDNLISTEDSPYPVYVWTSGNDELFYTDANIIYFNKLSSSTFKDLKLTSIDLTNFDTSKVTSMSSMFEKCKSLTELDLSNFDTSNVMAMGSLFKDCQSLTKLDLSNFDTSKVNLMSYMFDGCKSLTELDVSSFDTKNVQDMRGMFQNCQSLTKLDLSNFNTSNVENMYFMFSKASSLTELDLSNFDTSNVTYMNDMFSGCQSLTKLDVSSFNTKNVTTMSSMFSGCQSLSELDLSNFDTKNVTTMTSMFSGCQSLTELDISNFDTNKVTEMNGMFNNTLLTELDLSNFDTSNVENMYHMFYNMSKLTTIYVSDNWTTEKVVNANYKKSVFSSDTRLMGYKGTPYNSTKTDTEYARIDNAPEEPGYLTHVSHKGEVHSVTFPDGTVELYNHNSIVYLDKNEISKPSVTTGEITFKYHDEITEDKVISQTNTYTPDGFIVNGEDHYDDNGEVRVNEDKIIAYDFIENITGDEWPENPTREGYKFDGWYTEELGGEKVESYDSEEDITLHAHWISLSATLDNIEVNIGELTEEFDKDKTSYTWMVPKGTEALLNSNVEVTKTDPSSEISMPERVEFTEDGVTYEIVVTAEDGVTTKTYTLTLEHIKSSNANLTSLVPSIGSLDYNNDISDYVINVDDTIKKISFIATPEDEDATVEGLAERDLDYGDNEITIKVTSEDKSVSKLININVVMKPAVESINVENDKITLFKGDTININASTVPEGTSAELVYSSDDATCFIDDEGNVTGLIIGKTKVKVSLKYDETIYTEVEVTVITNELESERYEVSKEEDKDKIIIGLEPGTTIEEFKENLSNPKEYINVYDKDGNLLTDEDEVKTGLIVKLEHNEKVYDEAIMVVRGDVDGDGVVNVTDYMTVLNHVLELENIDDYIMFKASDVEIDNTLNVTDYIKIMDYSLENLDTLN